MYLVSTFYIDKDRKKADELIRGIFFFFFFEMDIGKTIEASGSDCLHKKSTNCVPSVIPSYFIKSKNFGLYERVGDAWWIAWCLW